MKTKVQQPSNLHRQFREDLVVVLRKYGNRLSAQEMLALSAHLVGQIIAMQDQRSMTPEIALKIVSDNIEQGNKEVIDGLFRAPATTRS